MDPLGGATVPKSSGARSQPRVAAVLQVFFPYWGFVEGLGFRVTGGLLGNEGIQYVI